MVRNERAIMAKVGRRELTVGYIMEIDGEWCFYREVAKSRDLYLRKEALRLTVGTTGIP